MTSPTSVLERYDDLPAWARWSITVALLLTGWAIAAIVLPEGAPLGRVLTGMILGSATALTSIGLILIYRSNRIVNFAYGAMGAATGVTAIRLSLIWHWNYALVFLFAIVSGVIVGLLTELLVIRRFEKSSRLILTVATIGLTQVLGGIELLMPGWVFGDEFAVTIGGFETPLSKTNFSVGVEVIDGNHMLIVAVVPVVVAALAWFLGRSRAGAAIRASAENSDRARLLGIPVRRMQSLVWAVAGGLATLTLVLKAPFVGTPPTAALGPAVLIPALAAAVIARMESLPVACVAALALGALDQVVRWNSSSPAMADVVMLIVILASLLLRRASRSRAHDADASWQDTSAVRPVPAALARLPEVRVARVVALVALIAAVVLVPITLGPSTLNTLNVTAIWGIVALSLVVLTGWNGQISLGQFAFVGCGAMMAGNLMSRWNVDFFLALVGAAATGAVIALLLGLPALRIRGPFLAVVTLSFAVVLDGYVLNPNNFPSIIPQNVDRPVLWQRFAMQDERVLFYVCAAILALVVLCLRGVRRSRSGRLLIAGRDNRKAAEAMSVPTRHIALTGFVFSGAIAGLAGGLHVTLLNGARVGSYQTVSSVEVFSMTTIGGLSSIGGGLSGALGLRGLQDAMPSSGARLLLLGTGLLVVLMVVPGGLASIAFGLRDRVLRLIARRRGIAIAGLERDESLRSPTPSPTSSASAPPATAAADDGLFATRSLDVSYGQLQVLFGVDFDVREGEMVALLGTNGAGKSTLLKAMCGLVGSKGEVTFAGRSIRGRRPEQIVREGVALMPGGRSIFPTLEVAEHLRLATWTFRKDRERIENDTREVLELFPSLQRRLHNLAGDLSGGEQQQLALAQTLLLKPRILLIDELSLGLAPTVVALLLDVVRELNRAGTTVVVVEQSVNVALSLADRAVFMEKGQVRFEGPTRDLLDRPDILRSVFLEGAAALTGASDSANGNAAADEEPIEMPTVDLSELDVLASLETPASTHASSNGAATNGAATNGAGSNGTATNGTTVMPVLECREVTKRFGGVIAVDGVDLVVQPGEIVGLVGQNGAGKTTLVDCISGFHRIDRGRIIFRGHDVTEWHPFERARGRLGRSFQEARLFPSLTVYETVAVACERQVSSRALVGDAFRQPASYESELEIEARVDTLIDLLGLTDHRDKLTSELSTGTRRIVELACLLAEDPVLLLLDEPSAGVAQKEAEVLGPLLRRIRDVTGAAMVIIEHDMPLLAGLCDRLVALDLGAVIATGDAETVLADELVVASYLGTDMTAINRSGATSVT